MKSINSNLDYRSAHKIKTSVANFESLADKITENLDSHKREVFYNFVRAYVDISTKNVYAATD